MNKLALVALALAVSAPALAQSVTDVNVMNPVWDPGNVITPPDTMPFVQSVYVVNGANTTTARGDFDVIPNGYRLIIDYVSLHIGAPAGQRVWAVFKPCDNVKGPGWGMTPIPTSVIPTFDDKAQSMGVAPMHLYADPTCAPFALAIRNGTTGNFGGTITLHGHYVRLGVEPR